MHNPESFLENETHTLLWDFKIQGDHQTSARRLELIIVNNKKRELAELWTLLSRRTTVRLIESEKKGKYQDLA